MIDKYSPTSSAAQVNGTSRGTIGLGIMDRCDEFEDMVQIEISTNSIHVH